MSDTEEERKVLARRIDPAIYPAINHLTSDGWEASLRAADAVLAALPGLGWVRAEKPTRLTARTVHPKCVDCGHSERSHNDLGYCQTGAGTFRECHCGGWDDGRRRQPDGSLA